MSKIKNYLTGIVLLLCAFGAAGQEVPATGIQREVAYQTSMCKSFKLPCDVEIDSLSGQDWIYLQTRPLLVKRTEIRIVDFWFTFTYLFPQRPRYERDYEFQIGKSVTDAWGSRLYTHEGEEFYRLDNEEVDESFAITAAEIETYGLFNGMFEMPIAEIVAHCDSAGIPIYVWEQKLLIVQQEEGENTRTEVETDFENLYSEIRVFENNIHTLTDRMEYQRVNGFIIPTKIKKVSYSELPSEIRYQITEVETYENYTVTGGNGLVLVDWTLQNEQPFSITVTPNPADEQITVHFSTPLDGEVNITIKDIANLIVWEKDVYMVGNDYPIDITALEAGLYTVVCTYENKVVQTDFLKEGIGQYPIQVNIDIQAVPNPATNNISILFPEDINAIMNVKIIDLMGTKYLDKAMYIQDNALQIIDISHLPAGIYYVFCINNDWTGYTQFIKQ